MTVEEADRLDATEEEAAKRASSTRKRPYAPDSGLAATLRQWFAPLPKEPKTSPLGLGEVRSRLPKATLGDDAAEMSARADCLLREATTLWDARQERITTWEAKATNLMSAVAIAVSLLTAGAGLLLDPNKVEGAWRNVLAVAFLVPLLSLLMCGYLASRAVLKVFLVSRPQARQALQRACAGGPSWQSNVDRAADLIARAGANLYIADYKLAQVRAAYGWFRVALVGFLLLGALIATRAATL